jgi:hypothetical protein
VGSYAALRIALFVLRYGRLVGDAGSVTICAQNIV